MVFLGGPRQVGKTTLSRQFIHSSQQYLNWDLDQDRRLILQNKLDPSLALYVLDEIHKYARWRGFVKGYFDKYRGQLNFLVTGSARLDYFRKGGDSLVGRYHYLRLHPLSLRELNQTPSRTDLEALLKFGGFPEPFIKQDVAHHGRWQMERISRVVTQDLRDLETVKEISLIELLTQLLSTKVGSALSIKSLQEDLSVSPNTVERWIGILERLYYCFRILPYGPPKVRAVKKTPKLYLWDWSEVENQGARFENLVASQLLKFCHFEEDTKGLKTEIRYFKDIQKGHEIDFVVLQKGKPLFAVECKSGDRNLSKPLVDFGHKLGIPLLYQVHLGSKEFGVPKTGRMLPFTKFCSELNLP